MPPVYDPQDSEPFAILPVHQIQPRANPQRWLIETLFASSSVGLIGGPPKAFKTWIAAELALATCAGTPAFGRFAVPDPGPVLFFGAEDPPPDLKCRFDGIARARGVDLARIPLLLLDVAQLHLDDSAHLDRLRRTVALHRPRLLVLDPFVRLVGQLDENSAREVSCVLGALRTLQREHNVSVLLTHHMRKSPAAHPAQQLRGSGDFSAWADSGLYLTRRGDDRLLVIEHRSAVAPPPLRLRLTATDPVHLAICDPPNAQAAAPLLDALSTRIVEHLQTAARPLPTTRLRDTLRVRKADLLAALRAIESSGLVKKTPHGWALT